MSEVLVIKAGIREVNINYRQITNIDTFTTKDIQNYYVNKNKGTISRSVIGGLLFDPVGAAIGATSGINKGVKKVEDVTIKHYITISYKSKQTSESNTINFECRRSYVSELSDIYSTIYSYSYLINPSSVEL